MPENNYYKNDHCPKCYDVKRVKKTKPARVAMVDHCSRCGFTIQQIYNTKDDLLVDVKEEFMSLGVEESLAIALLNIQSVVHITSRKKQLEYFDVNVWNNILSVIQEVQPLISIVLAGNQTFAELLEKAGYPKES
jgi:hypothetical protein